MLLSIILPFAINLEANCLADDFKRILLHLKPSKVDTESGIRVQLDHLYGIINEKFDESNISSFYDVALKDSKFSNFALSLLHNWGIGVREDRRVSVLRLNLGVLDDDQISFLAFNHKSLIGMNVPKGCQANLGTFKNIVDSISFNFSLFERKEGSLVYVDNYLKVKQDSIVKQIISNLDEIKRTNPRQLYKFIEFYLSSSSAQTPELNRKIVSFLKDQLPVSNQASAYLAMVYLKYYDNDTNYLVEAKRLLELAASHDSPYAYLGLGVLYFYGLGVETNYTTAFNYFLLANRSGLTEATTYLGIHYLIGLGVTPDSRLALRNTMLGANKGYLLALYTLGFMHERGIGVFYSCKYAVEMYSIIVEYKLMRSYIFDAVRDYHNGHILKALIKFLIFSEMGSPYAMINAAFIIEKHKIPFFTVDERLKKMFKIWSHAAMLGNPKATIKVGDCYFYGLGVQQNYKDAFENYQTAAIIYREPEAMYNLGYMYEHGFGIKKSLEAAENFYMISSQFDEKTKTLISFVLLKLRLKHMYGNFWRFASSFVKTMNENFKMISKYIINEYENISVVILTLIIVFITKLHLTIQNQPL